jgi:periplasmic divalent cation tolerance protein
MNHQAVLLYMTAANVAEAEKIGDALVTERLVACVNIVREPIQAMFHWQGNVERGSEIAFFAKTTPSRLSAINKIVLGLHSYECPCLIALPIVGGNPDFLSWIEQETLSPQDETL